MVSRKTNLFIIIILFLTVILSGCSNPLDKSVYQTLTSKELDRVAGKDPSFLATYSLVEGKFNKILTHDDSLRWQSLTYERLHSFISKINSVELNAPVYNQLRERWEQKFKEENIKVDSILKYWKHYTIKNSPDSIASATFDGVEIEKIRNINKQIDTLIKMRVKIKALKERIDSIHISYAICDMTLDSTISQNPAPDNLIKHRRKISDSIIVKIYPQIDNPQTKRRFIYKDSSLYFSPILVSVFSQGKCYNADTIKSKVPKSVQVILDSAQNRNEPDIDLNYYRESIIREFLDSDYISQTAYIKLNSEKYYMQIDSLAFNFLHL